MVKYTHTSFTCMIFIPFSRKTKARVLSLNGVMMPSTYIAHIQANLGHKIHYIGEIFENRPSETT